MAFDLQQRLQNPWVQLGAAIMAASDPQRRGLGGLGAGIMGYNQQQRALSESELARRKTEMEIDALQSKIDQRTALRSIFEGGGTPTAGQVAQAMPLFAAQQILKSAYATPKNAGTSIGKLNQDLAAGRITQDQFDQEVDRIYRPTYGHLSVTPLEGGGFVTTDLERMQANMYIPGVGSYTVPITPPAQALPGPADDLTDDQLTELAMQPGVTPETAQEAQTSPMQPSVSPQGVGAPQAAPAAPQMPPELEARLYTQQVKNLPAAVQSRYVAAEDALNRIPRIIEAAAANPEAFGGIMSDLELAPEFMRGGAMETLARRAHLEGLTPEQHQARIAVMQEAAQIVNQLAGQAVSEQERQRIESFAPKEGDDIQSILDKLNQALLLATESYQSIGETYLGREPERSNQTDFRSGPGYRYRRVK